MGGLSHPSIHPLSPAPGSSSSGIFLTISATVKEGGTFLNIKVRLLGSSVDSTLSFFLTKCPVSSATSSHVGKFIMMMKVTRRVKKFKLKKNIFSFLTFFLFSCYFCYYFFLTQVTRVYFLCYMS